MPQIQTPGDKLSPRWGIARQAESFLASFADGEVKAQGKLESRCRRQRACCFPTFARRSVSAALRTKTSLARLRSHGKSLSSRMAKPGESAAACRRAGKTQVRVGEKARLLISSVCRIRRCFGAVP